MLPAYRGRGLAIALLAQAEGYTRQLGATALKINVLARNTLAWEVYRRVGFREYEITLLKGLEQVMDSEPAHHATVSQFTWFFWGQE